MKRPKLVFVGDSLEKLPRQAKVKTSAYQASGALPIIDQGKNHIAGYTDDNDLRYDGSLPLTIFGDHTRILKWVDRPFAVGADGTQLLRGDHRFDQRYFYYALCSLELEHFGYERHFKYLKEEQILLPDLPTQRKIAGILSAYDDLIENNLRRIKILEQMAQSLYREWFVHFRFPRDPSEASAKEGGHESVPLIDSPLGLIPLGWEVKKLAEIAGVNEQSIRATNAPEKIQYIDIASVSTGAIDHIEEMSFESAPSRARRVVRHGDIIWSTLRPNRRSFSLIIDPAENLIASTGFAVFSARAVPWSYLYQATTTDEFTNYLVNHASGAAYPAVNSIIFENANVVVPPNVLLSRFNQYAEANQMLQHKLQCSNKSLRRTRELILPKLLNTT